jgi:predicted  nucleic acid-binding Zn-ribbon protein
MNAGMIAWAALATLYALTLALGRRRLLSLRADVTRAQAALTAQRDAHTDTAPAQTAEVATLRDTLRALEAERDAATHAQKRVQRQATDTAAQYIQRQDTLTHLHATADADRQRLTALSDTLSQRVRELEDAASQLESDKAALSQKVTHLQYALANVQRATQTADKAQATESARLQQHREAALNKRVRELEAALQEARNREAIAAAHQGSSAQLQQHIQDLKAKLQTLRERERSILKVMQDEVAALNQTASRAYARGLVEGVCIDGVISPTEKVRVDQWFTHNGFPAAWAQRLFLEVQAQYDAQWLASDGPDLAPADLTSPSPSAPVTAEKLQRLRDLIAATAADGVISYEELRMLRRWADENAIPPDNIKALLLDAKRAHPGELLIQSHPSALSHKEKGDAFEQYVVGRFSSPVFHLIEWRGDKVTAEGKFARASMLPDLELELRLRDQRHRFAVECKWRSNLGPDGELAWCRPEQLTRYQAFETQRGVPVFVVIGLGGMPQEPHSVFAIPLRDLSSPSIPRPALSRYRHDPAKPFFYDRDTCTLR